MNDKDLIEVNDNLKGHIMFSMNVMGLEKIKINFKWWIQSYINSMDLKIEL